MKLPEAASETLKLCALLFVAPLIFVVLVISTYPEREFTPWFLGSEVGWLLFVLGYLLSDLNRRNNP